MKVSSMIIPVCTWSPTFNSDISTDFPQCRLTLAPDGKHPALSPGASGGAVAVAASEQQRKPTVWHSRSVHLGQHCSVNTARPVIKEQQPGPPPQQYSSPRDCGDREYMSTGAFISMLYCSLWNYVGKDPGWGR